MGKGIPQSIVSDRDSVFASGYWNDFAKNLGISIALSTSRHQETDGSTEIAIKAIKHIFQTSIAYNSSPWGTYVTAVEYAINDSVSTTTG